MDKWILKIDNSFNEKMISHIKKEFKAQGLQIKIKRGKDNCLHCPRSMHKTGVNPILERQVLDIVVDAFKLGRIN
jgi:hypothetical protein